MLSTIPASILKDTLILSVPQSFNVYMAPTPQVYTVNRVHLQNDNKTTNINTGTSGMNSQVTLVGTIFIDARLSYPRLDYEALQEQAQASGGVMTCRIRSRGVLSREFVVNVIDGLPDDEGNLHHWELGVT